MPPTRPYNLAAFLLLICSLILITSVPGCSDAQVEQYRLIRAETLAALAEAKAQLAVANQHIAELQAQIDAAEEGPDRDAAIEARDTIQKVVDKANAAIPQMQEDVTQLTAAIDAGLAGNTAEAVRIGGRFIAAKAPPPWNVYILGGSTLLGALLTYRQKRIADEERERKELARQDAEHQAKRANETRRAAESVIEAIEYQKGGDDVVDFSDDNTRVSLRSSMSTEARELVEHTRRKLPPRAVNLEAAPAETAG